MEDPILCKKIRSVHENTTADEMKEIIEAVKNSAAIDKAFAFSERYLHKALEMIKPLPRGQAKYALQNVAKYIENENFSVFSKNKIISLFQNYCTIVIRVLICVWGYTITYIIQKWRDFLWKNISNG